MSVSSPCEICGQPAVEFSCTRCAALVCDEHYDRETGLCAECRSDVGGSDGVPSGEDLPDGVDTYRF